MVRRADGIRSASVGWSSAEGLHHLGGRLLGVDLLGDGAEGFLVALEVGLADGQELVERDVHQLLIKKLLGESCRHRGRTSPWIAAAGPSSATSTVSVSDLTTASLAVVNSLSRSASLPAASLAQSRTVSR